MSGIIGRRKDVALITVVAILCTVPWGGVHAWGGLFNRFSPEMLANMGYGGNGYAQPSFLQGVSSGEDTVSYGNERTVEDVDPCYEKQCTANEHCCPGSVCVDVDGVGRCLFSYGRRVGELCRRDSDCESGLLCGGGSGQPRICQPPAIGNKQYGELCHSSGQCDITRGLCCILQRRHRQQPRKACSYFKDPLICIGPVATDQIKSSVEHTAGEKRITSYHHLN